MYTGPMFTHTPRFRDVCWQTQANPLHFVRTLGRNRERKCMSANGRWGNTRNVCSHPCAKDTMRVSGLAKPRTVLISVSPRRGG